MVGISQHPNSLNESFYFDKKHDHFFSIHALDYFMLDEHLDLAIDITKTSYSEQEVTKIISLIQRIDRDDKDLLFVPRLSHNERIAALNDYLSTIDHPKETEKIKKQYVKDNEEFTDFDKRFEIESTPEIADGWHHFKYDLLRPKAETFLNLNAININNARILDFGSEAGFTIDLIQDNAGHKIKPKTKWWQFWK